MTMETIIKSIQYALNFQGEKLQVDGVAGPLTLAAMDKYNIEFTLTKKVSTPVVVTPTPTTPVGGKKNELWYPKAIRNIAGITYNNYGRYPTKSGLYSGVVLHFSATRGGGSKTPQEAEKNSIKLITYLDSQGYGTISIDSYGRVYQNQPFNQSSAHAGASSWNGKTSLNKHFLGLDLQTAGLLTPKEISTGEKLKYKDGKFLKNSVEIPQDKVGLYAWYGEIIPFDRCIWGPKKDNCVEGWYEKAPQLAIDAMYEFLVWSYFNSDDFSVENICNHDECCPGRKNDLGWTVGKTGPEIRAHVLKLIEEEKNRLDFSPFNDHLDPES